eukprot:CAMPEP_0178823536 /NCGR_PEP_ID=MMETSP0746-20121128/5192_1 /TAXON_ID=913974 /ORGANISM="Nitzschia punctata, Strain CCMP561" /LENGTH=1132 /DNA_ID=CAMNT_0020485143 /DNA_START=67 /DNA_END=3465 /DNA_ORIENTATION=-
MKMRTKREQRPLLTQEAPVLSDQMDPGGEEEQGSTQQSKQHKKRPWRRLFGKGGGTNYKRKENQNPLSLVASSEDFEQCEKASQPHASKNQSLRQEEYSRNGMSDKRDDATELCQSNSSQVKQFLEMEPPTPSEQSIAKPVKRALNTAPLDSLTSKTAAASAAATAASPAVKSALTQPHRNHVSPRQHPASASSATNPGSRLPNHQPRDRESSLSSLGKNKNTPSSPSRNMPHKILTRPFGREHILMTEQTWIVHVARAEWDPDDSMWKYRVTIQKRDGNKVQDFASSFLLRSLQDFYWLEQALTTEFFGGLLLPSLSIYLGVSNIENCQHEVDSRLLANWLSDSLNGVRGQGEILFRLNKVDVATSESMEAFLYRADLMQILEIPKTPKTPTPQKNLSTNKKGNSIGAWNFFPELCYTDCVKPSSPITEAIKTPVNAIKKCSSPALGSARTFNVQQDSFVEAATFEDIDTSLAIHSDLLKAERDLVLSWRRSALQAMEKLRILQEQEKHVGASWKRFAISVSNLFAYEKDVETARLGDSKSRRELQMPYRKLQKSTVDDCLRILALQKVERATPSIEAVNAMLSAYVADLSMVRPAVQAYLEGLRQLENEKVVRDSVDEELKAESIDDSSQSLTDKIQASLQEVKKQLTTANNESSRSSKSKKVDERRYRQRQQIQSIENRLLVNEALLKDFMTTLCRTAPVRTARMMSTYLEKEMAQCNALHQAAVDMKAKINIGSKETLSKMIQRHHAETKEDRNTELKLVYKIVNIGNSKKFSKDNNEDASEEIEKGVELSQDMKEVEARKTKLRDKAMNLCRDRIGRWDAKVAMAIMEAVGVSDANVRVEETTRDLRMVRKYAIGLRENVERCVEALDLLRMSILQGGAGDIRDLRHDFFGEMRSLLSLTFLPVDDENNSLPFRLLQNEGIDISDRNGWRSHSHGTCGNSINAYIETRDSGTEWLLEALGELLKEYNQRVEAVESFVYMECVGIQLEKHFSQARATALAAFEKKTDITSAINIATRKKMPVLVKELQAKLVAVGADVSHTTVKEAKEAHLESKAFKQELHDLAMRRLTRARETSTERAIALMNIWSKEEEGSASTEKEILEDLVMLLQKSVKKEDYSLYAKACPARI